MSNSNSQLRVLMIDLPVPRLNPQETDFFAPLASGYLKAMAYKEGLLDKVDIKILDRINTNLSGDARLVKLIVSNNIDLLCFSLYPWNLLRSLFIAKKVKECLTCVNVIVGGPEVTPDAQRTLSNIFCMVNLLWTRLREYLIKWTKRLLLIPLRILFRI
jgi:hypothetical protein